MLRKVGLVVVAVLAVALLVPAPAKAAFPERDITLIVPWAPGGGTDTLARTLVKNGKKYFGVNINVQNVTGGTGAIGMNQVARAKADGYTVALITFNLSTYRLLGQSELSYRDFDLIALLNRSIAGLTVKADSQFKTLKDLVEYAKANPGVVTVGHSGPAGAWHLAGVAIANTGFASWVGTWTIAQDASNGNNPGVTYSGTVGTTTVRLIRASSAVYGGIYSNHDIDTYDDYTVEADVRLTNNATKAALIFRNDSSSNAGYFLMINRSGGGNTTVTLNYDTNLTSDSGVTALDTDNTAISFSTSAIYHLRVDVDGSTITYVVEKNGVVISSDTVTHTALKTGGPGFRLIGNNAYFDNFEICTN